jgi:hypothetical protein
MEALRSSELSVIKDPHCAISQKTAFFNIRQLFIIAQEYFAAFLRTGMTAHTNVYIIFGGLCHKVLKPLP